MYRIENHGNHLLADDGVVLQPQYHCEGSDINYKYEVLDYYFFNFSR